MRHLTVCAFFGAIVVAFHNPLFADEPPKITEVEQAPVGVKPKYKFGVALRDVRVEARGETYLGARITGVLGGTPAAKSRIEKNDVIVGVNGKNTKTTADFIDALNNSNGKVTIKVLDHRTGKVTELKDIKLDAGG